MTHLTFFIAGVTTGSLFGLLFIVMMYVFTNASVKVSQWLHWPASNTTLQGLCFIIPALIAAIVSVQALLPVMDKWTASFEEPQS